MHLGSEGDNNEQKRHRRGWCVCLLASECVRVTLQTPFCEDNYESFERGDTCA